MNLFRTPVKNDPTWHHFQMRSRNIFFFKRIFFFFFFFFWYYLFTFFDILYGSIRIFLEDIFFSVCLIFIVIINYSLIIILFIIIFFLSLLLFYSYDVIISLWYYYCNSQPIVLYLFRWFEFWKNRISPAIALWGKKKYLFVLWKKLKKGKIKFKKILLKSCHRVRKIRKKSSSINLIILGILWKVEIITTV